MKYLYHAALAALLIATSCSFTPQQSGKKMTKNESRSGFAVVELFTSEGCSSCPPADRVMAELAQQYADKPVLFVGMHVDYWDRLGWKDPFSQHAFTERQNEYGSFFKNESVYTPQAVVNGRREMVGSTRAAVISAIDEGLIGNGSGRVSITAKAESGGISVTYNAEGTPGDQNRVVLMLVQRKAITDVKRGENGGRKLEHINIVRSMQYKTDWAGSSLFAAAAAASTNDVFVAAIVQEQNSGKIVAFAKVDVL